VQTERFSSRSPAKPAQYDPQDLARLDQTRETGWNDKERVRPNLMEVSGVV
jgi:hypothetical protein